MQCKVILVKRGAPRRGVNHSLEISGNPCKKLEIWNVKARNPFENQEISYDKCWSDLPLAPREVDLSI